MTKSCLGCYWEGINAFCKNCSRNPEYIDNYKKSPFKTIKGDKRKKEGG